MAVNPELWNSDDSEKILAINYGIGDAGTILPLTTTFVPGDVHADTEIIDIDIDIATGTGIKFTTSEADLPDPLVVGILYFAIRVDATHIRVATTYANAIAEDPINLTDGGAGIHSITIDNEYHIWNDKGMELEAAKLTSVKITVRDSNGLEIENIVTQRWVQVKSTTIEEGIDGDATGEFDDNMPEFQAIGKDAYLNIGDIPADCYRIIFIRVQIPTSALKAGVSFKIYVTCLNPQSSIAKWITELHGNGVVYRVAGAFGVSIGTPTSELNIEKGFALISSSEIYHGATRQYDVSELEDGVYKIYLTSVGIVSSIIATSSIPTNSIELSRATIVSGVATAVVDKRNFIMQRIIPQHFQDLLAANVSGIHVAITGTGAIQNITNGITNPDYARNSSIATTNNASPSGNVKIVGLVRGKNDEEDIPITPGSTVCGNKAFDTVAKIVIPAGVTASDTVTVGFSDKIGLDNPIVVAGDVFKKKVNNEDKTFELSEKVSATYHTVDCADIVANEDMLLKYKSILTI